MFYTLRGLDLRTPLCAIGVASCIEVRFNPVPANPRIADSRPGPIPLTTTLIFIKLYLFAFSKTSLATILAAYGVDFLAPLNPIKPDEDQARMSPLRSLISISVLLYEMLMWAIPLMTCFFVDFLEALLTDPSVMGFIFSSVFVITFFCPMLGGLPGRPRGSL